MNTRKTPSRAQVIREHLEQKLPDPCLRFSFKHLQTTPKFGLPDLDHAASYLRQLLDRLQAVSTLHPAEFRTSKGKSLRAHRHLWSKTTEQNGFAHLPPSWQREEAWQFQLSANKHGRVHGILVDEVFYIVWLDPEHRLYQ
ncbi:hypothetical protein [Roseateles noduli]|uniref:hypothetical protein n=1 Tax=Roseateles noduli TaxID=2052484 RepID=UPI003D64BD49